MLQIAGIEIHLFAQRLRFLMQLGYHTLLLLLKIRLVQKNSAAGSP
ncbi:hypothetical protein [Sodalis-like endosymbiont of Proechinophthirus fluctus]|nr:hypothetical protein [Sodalis-like endosymbiont of Proechinophthirus fluctus]